MLKLKLQYFGCLMQKVAFSSWKRLWCWEGLGAGGEEDDRGRDGWMASPTWWTWVWVNSGSWWWTGRTDVLRFTGSQRVRHNWVTELNWTDERWVEFNQEKNSREGILSKSKNKVVWETVLNSGKYWKWGETGEVWCVNEKHVLWGQGPCLPH